MKGRKEGERDERTNEENKKQGTQLLTTRSFMLDFQRFLLPTRLSLHLTFIIISISITGTNCVRPNIVWTFCRTLTYPLITLSYTFRMMRAFPTSTWNWNKKTWFLLTTNSKIRIQQDRKILPKLTASSRVNNRNLYVNQTRLSFQHLSVDVGPAITATNCTLIFRTRRRTDTFIFLEILFVTFTLSVRWTLTFPWKCSMEYWRKKIMEERKKEKKKWRKEEGK